MNLKYLGQTMTAFGLTHGSIYKTSSKLRRHGSKFVYDVLGDRGFTEIVFSSEVEVILGDGAIAEMDSLVVQE